MSIKEEEIIFSVIHQASSSHISSLVSNLEQAWKLSNEDLSVFLKKVTPFINGYLQRMNSPFDVNEMREALKEATDDEVSLSFKNKQWALKPTEKHLTLEPVGV
jgi:iron-sulfur cluster repair protein YtfE (RIC family)